MTATQTTKPAPAENTFRVIALPALVLLIISGGAALLLAVVNNMTQPVIERRDKEATEAAMALVMEAADTFSDEQTAQDGTIYYEGYDAQGGVCGYVFTTHGSGYGGDIAVMTGVDADGRVAGIAFLSIEETPGMGMKAQNDDFRTQYIGKSGRLSVSKTTASDTEIQAITGATITSNAVTNAVNDALACWAALNGEAA